MRYVLTILLAASWVAWFDAASFDRSAAAQTKEDTASEEIYLDEPRPAPAPRAMGKKTYLEQYADKSTRVKRSVKLMSDDSVINHGPYEEYWRNGEKFSEGVFKDGVHHGEWSFWHPNGQLNRTVNFVEGRPDGKWKAYREDGSLEAEREYVDGKREGTWIVYHPDGKTPRVELPYQNGRLEGLRKSFYVNGQERQRAPHTEGRVDGIVVEWDEAGRKVLEVEFSNGEQNGRVLRNTPSSASGSEEAEDESGDTIQIDEASPTE
ncbi:MAG: toxin-antitoxin system YwqK family antitoxin [Planctomycetota bacterium]